MENRNFVCYEDFGAKGDGKTNDFEAMLAAHTYANENRLAVFGTEGKTYLITDTEKDGVARSIIIKTNVNWHGATIIIDDTDIAHEEGAKRNYNTPIFLVEPDEGAIEIDEEKVKAIGALKKTDTKIDLGLGYPAMIVVYNECHRVYIRYGPNANAGSPQHELLIIDAEGNIDPTTPLMHDYEKLTKITARKIDLPELVIENGTVIGRASRVNTIKTLPDGTKVKNKKYFHRHMNVSRSNTLVRNVKNYLEGEISLEDQANGIDGPAYRGFFSATNANNVIFESCVVTARRYYTPGTYGFGATCVNNVVLKNCTQSNFYLKDENGNDTGVNSMEVSPLTKKCICWGLGGTNFCKNMVYDGCTITRFDAHQGLCNGKIINSKVSYINLIGYGDMLIENSLLELKEKTMFQLRADYGATWEGTVTIRNCDVSPNEAVVKRDELTVLAFRWINHDFGYTCHFPSVLLDGVRLTKRDVPVHLVTYGASGEDWAMVDLEDNIHKDILSDGVTANKNPIVPPKFIRVINNEGGHKYYVKKLPFFENTEIEGFVIEN